MENWNSFLKEIEQAQVTKPVPVAPVSAQTPPVAKNNDPASVKKMITAWAAKPPGSPGPDAITAKKLNSPEGRKLIADLLAVRDIAKAKEALFNLYNSLSDKNKATIAKGTLTVIPYLNLQAKANEGVVTDKAIEVSTKLGAVVDGVLSKLGGGDIEAGFKKLRTGVAFTAIAVAMGMAAAGVSADTANSMIELVKSLPSLLKLSNATSITDLMIQGTEIAVDTAMSPMEENKKNIKARKQKVL